MEVKKDFTVRGDLASDWSVEDGGKTIVFDLVKNATFHNGDEVTAKDVQFSANRVVNADVSVHSDKLSVLKTPVDGEGVVVEDDYKVRMNLSEAFAPIFINLTPNVAPSGAIVSQRAIKEMGKSKYNLQPVGSGPFKVTGHELGSSLTADAHTEYHKTSSDGDPLPYLDGLDVKPVQEAQTRVSAIRTGSVDFVSLVPAAQADQIDKASDVVLESRLGPNFGGLGFNNDAEPFTDERVRMAAAKAIDNERYVKETFLGYGAADTSIYNPVIDWVWREEYGDAPDKKPKDQLYDPEGAKKLAKEAGAMDLELTMTVAQPELRGARVMRNMLQETLGWKVELDQLDFPTLFERAANGNFTFMPWGNSTVPEPDLTVSSDFGPPGKAAQNWWNYYPDDHAELIKEQRKELDQDKRKKLLWKIEDKIIERAAWALIEHQVALSARRRNVKNYFHYGPIKRFRDVYLAG